ncbi:copper resistance protein B [Frateuria aurantia]|uniref:Uncharacterized protein involved in copper resistance n=1 Tax=Frateuria aurantia (strain ATCC 33424 / DSM 6220 / KCTC 2777 / LMG 1558 / NBRC 3245 / NCIMB 13370) TaxID=767434 RepID=H8KYB1_FRAAD|nr:copper resistance protein B [Frateuria aurantia]AFC86106.1 uncharacterized protein involved in copper resistance [Frateuria aurantia DSM 6220]
MRRADWKVRLAGVGVGLVTLVAMPVRAQMQMDMSGMPMVSKLAGHQHPPGAPSSDRPTQGQLHPPGVHSHLSGPRDGLPANDHVAPMVSADTMPLMPADKGMAMGDAPWLGMFLANELEWIGTPQGPQAAWDVEGWAGTPTRRLWVESEGESSSRQGSSARTELLFDQAMSRFWDWRAGYRVDAGGGPSRSWLAGGIQGLAPYWFEIEAMAYVSSQGRVAFRFEARYDMLLTQRLILSPKFETQVYSRADPRRELGGGLSDANLGLRLRYEFSRKFAPYIGVGWDQRFGATGSWARRDQVRLRGIEWMTGVRLWF